MNLLYRLGVCLPACLLACLAASAPAADDPLSIEIQTVATGPADYYFAQARGALISDAATPGAGPRIIVTIRETEQVLVPENKADLGNFGVLNVGPNESWVVVAEYPINTARRDERNGVFAAKIKWPVGKK